ncbi:MAG: M56 family metallopeptidase [Bacteroidales bacterium]|nr:M56 family metallopeptidase [Bacteroidales bacterium]
MATSIISIAIAVAVLWVAYRVLFINSNRLIFNRTFLIVALGFSLILPAAGVYIGRSTPQIASYRQSLFHGIMLDEVVITAEGVTISTPVETPAGDAMAVAPVQASSQKFNLWHYIWVVYLIGVGVMALLFLIKLARIAIVIIRSPKKRMPGYTAVFTGKEHGSYSFFNYAFFPNENVNSDIVRHEMSHIAHHHSADILFVELMMIIQWFNPFIYMYKRELQSLHEYMADRDVVATGIDKQNYMMLILQQCTAVDFSNMSNNFSFLLTKKRIKMITQSKKAKGVVIKALLTLPLFALLLFANCKSNGQNQASVETPAKDAVENESRTIIKLGEDSFVSFADPMEINLDGIDYTLDINSVKNEKTFKLGDHKVVAKNNHDERNSYTVTVDGEPFDLKYIVNMIFDETDESGDDDEVYGAVDVMPEYFGGVNAMFDFIQKNVKYPESAKKKGIEGRVFVQFVVEKDGNLSSFQVLRGVNDELNDEAIRVLKMMPKWKPGMKDGKPVRVQYTMPFKFQLSGNENTLTALSGTKWEGRGEGIGNDTAEGMKFVMDMTMDFYNNNDGLFVMKLMTQDKDGKMTPQTVFENVGLDFTYSFDGKSAGSIQPKNTDGSTLGGEDQLPYSFVMQDGKIIVNFYDLKDDCGIEKITFVKK